MDRRRFLKIAAAGAAINGIAGNQVWAQNGRPVAPSDRINVGIVGPGSRGQEMMRYLLRVPGVRIGGLADVYDARFAQSREITGEETPAYADYRRLLDAPDLDVVLVATPLSFHADHMVAALQSGRHVYGEKSLGFTVDHCNRILYYATAPQSQQPTSVSAP